MDNASANKNAKVEVDNAKVENIAQLLSKTAIPDEEESNSHHFLWKQNVDALANAYFAIVAICHQTSPLGERRLEGHINGQVKYGWDYLKEKYLLAADSDSLLCSPSRWMTITPNDLASLFKDESLGLTLNRVSERTYLLNDLGQQLSMSGCASIAQLFKKCGRRLGGNDGFVAALKNMEAYRDPAAKKAQFFLSIAIKECEWAPQDPEHLASPVDYHEMRGHLRIGMLRILDDELKTKVERGLTLTAGEDTALRLTVQAANDRIAKIARITTSKLHYLLWNVFRNCCPRNTLETHCSACPPTCGLPVRYKSMSTYQGSCIFASQCDSAAKPTKVSDPAYMGHYY